MSDEHILEGSDAGERPLLSYRQSWLAWAGPVLMLLVCVALCVAGQRYMPEFFWIFAGVGALLVLCMVYRILLVRSVHLYADSKGVWLYRGILPWNRGAVGVKWRDMEDAAFTPRVSAAGCSTATPYGWATVFRSRARSWYTISPTDAKP